jgi:hypothetical protein
MNAALLHTRLHQIHFDHDRVPADPAQQAEQEQQAQKSQQAQEPSRWAGQALPGWW